MDKNIEYPTYSNGLWVMNVHGIQEHELYLLVLGAMLEGEELFPCVCLVGHLHTDPTPPDVRPVGFRLHQTCGPMWRAVTMIP